MSLPPDTLRSLERLKSLQDSSVSEVSSSRRNRFLKTDNLFLLILLILLCGISAILIIVDQWQIKEIALVKQQPVKTDEKRDEVEISLGEFESVRSTPGKPGLLSILEYEVSISIGENMTSLKKIRQTLSHRKNRVRSAIEAVINNASPEELREPKLISLKASVKKQLSEVFEETEISSVMFSRFSMFNIPDSQ